MTREIQFDAEIVAKFNWTYYDLQEAPADWLNDIVLYHNLKAEYEAEQIELAKRQHK